MYFDKLIKEIKTSRITDKISTIFIGGGTPSSIDCTHIGKIMKTIYQNFNVDKNAEITIESNPNSLTLNKIKHYKEFQINRISLGVQTTSNEILKSIGRIHTFADFQKSAKIISNNFDNYNFDIMIGLPNQSMADVENTLTSVLKYNPPHISAYSLILEQNTLLAKMVDSGKTALPSDDTVVEQYNFVYDVLCQNNLPRYEISNFAKPNFECKHNQNYWTCGEYLGFGLSAHSYKNGIRFSNTNNINEYLNGTTKSFEEILSLQEQKEEMIMLALRTEQGLDVKKYNQKFNENLFYDKQKVIINLQKEKLIIVDGNILKIAPTAFYISNSIIEKLI